MVIVRNKTTGEVLSCPGIWASPCHITFNMLHGICHNAVSMGIFSYSPAGYSRGEYEKLLLNRKEWETIR